MKQAQRDIRDIGCALEGTAGHFERICVSERGICERPGLLQDDTADHRNGGSSLISRAGQQLGWAHLVVVENQCVGSDLQRDKTADIAHADAVSPGDGGRAGKRAVVVEIDASRI